MILTRPKERRLEKDIQTKLFPILQELDFFK